MSDTIVDMPKVSQMLDSGWTITIFKGGLNTINVYAKHGSDKRMRRIKESLISKLSEENNGFLSSMTAEEIVESFHFDEGCLVTDDFTPEQALTRMAYKVFGEVI